MIDFGRGYGIISIPANSVRARRGKDGKMSRLTREEIERAKEMNPNMTILLQWEPTNPHVIKFADLCDLALQSLSQEAVRDEVLNEGFAQGKKAAAKVCEECRVLILGDPAAKQGAVMIARETGRDLARQIEALKREPNAAAQTGYGTGARFEDIAVDLTKVAAPRSLR